MEHLALELLEHIFTLACTDGGRTGLALSLVSKHIRAASSMARFHSVSLTSDSSAQLASFLASLIPTTTNTIITPALAPSLGYTPRVQHLCLTLQTRARERRTDGGTTLQCASMARALFHAVAPTLRSLALVIRGELAGDDVLPQLGPGFPALEELSYEKQWAQYDQTDDEEDEDQGPGEDCEGHSAVQPAELLYPNLARLHLVLGPICPPDLPEWAVRAPRLTHLRISNLRYMNLDVLAGIQEVIVKALAAPRFPHLELLLVQPGAKPRPGRRGTPVVLHDMFLSILQRTQDNAHLPFEFIVTKPMQWTDEQREQDGKLTVVKHDWLARIEGGSGCWDVEALSWKSS